VFKKDITNSTETSTQKSPKIQKSKKCPMPPNGFTGQVIDSKSLTLGIIGAERLAGQRQLKAIWSLHERLHGPNMAYDAQPLTTAEFPCY
jgi:hypothetical protein